jgi:hypothetical protein
MRTIVSSILKQFQSGGYDTSLPPDIDGTFKAKCSVRKPTPVPAWLFPAVAVLLLALLVIWSTSGHKPVHEQVSVPEPITAPTPAPISRPAPRAVMVKLPVPRAELVRVPEWKVGQERLLLMPYNLTVRSTLQGRLPSTNMLPATGNQLGDTFVVGDTAWVWITQPGATQAAWVDP